MKRLALAIPQELIRDGLSAKISTLQYKPYCVVASVAEPSRIQIVSGNLPEILIAWTDQDPERLSDAIVGLRGVCGYPPLTTMLMCNQLAQNQLVKLLSIGVKAVIKNTASPGEIFSILALLPKHQVLDTSIIIPDGLTFSLLTDREVEVGHKLAAGMSIKEIAGELNLSAKTVDAHKFNLMRKLDLHNKAQLIHYFNNQDATSRRIVVEE